MSNDPVSLKEDTIEEIAVIGLAGRFPGSKNVDEFWQNLRNGVDSISRFTDQELESLGIAPSVLSNPNYVKAKGRLEDIKLFDASFFGLSPREAETMDPQHRIFLEMAWEVLENAGYDSSTYPGPIGVFAGASMNHYVFNLYSEGEADDTADDYQKIIGIEKDFLSTRVSYKLNLKGPSLTVQTGCSTSLVAVQLACQSLLNYQCSMALAGGVCLNLGQKGGYFYQEEGIPSPDGYCRAFDAKAEGTVLSEGVSIVVLKRLSEALADGDTINAVIKGIATNNDGSMKVGFTAPSVDGQAEVIAMAQALSDVKADTISYIEAHGTGTSLGDPIEIAALTQAFGASTDKKGFCAIGSVKTNIGHTDVAAGIAGLIKTILMLKHKEIPSSLHFEKPNPKIDFETSPFYVATKLTEWKTDGTPRRAGVSSFGIGGTNAHAVLEESPVIEASGESRSWQLILFSAQTSNALSKIAANFVDTLKKHPHLNLGDIAYTLQVGRKTFDHRQMVVCQDRDDAVNTLGTPDPRRVLTSFQEPGNRDVVFMFPGQGSQYVNMGLELYRTESEFKEQIDRCSEILESHLSLDLRDILFPKEENAEQATQTLRQTYITQPALFAIEYAFAKLWMSWGIHPTAFVGHSIGEYVAACLAGVFSLEDALSLVAIRGKLMQQLPGGSMLAVHLSEKEIEPFLNDKLSISAINSPSLCVVSGENEAITDLEGLLSEKDVGCQQLHTSHAFHSKMVDPVFDTFTEQVKQVSLNPPQIPIISTVTGTWTTPDEMTSPDYWAKNLRYTVRFSDCVKELLGDSDRVFLEVGPGHTLSTFVRQQLNRSKEQIVVTSIRHPQEQKSDIAFILNTLGQLWLAGVQPDWSGFYKDERRHREPLPTYPFERQRFWVELQKPSETAAMAHKFSQKKADLAEWFYLPSWKRSQLPKKQVRKSLSDQKLCWLIFLDECGLGAELMRQLKHFGQKVTAVKAGIHFSPLSEEVYTINPESKEDYHSLLKALRSSERIPHAVVHLWCITASERTFSEHDFFKTSQYLGFNSLLFLMQAFDEHNYQEPIEIKVISNHLQEVTGEEALSPEKATLLGPCLVAPQEYPNIRFTSIDVVLPKMNSQKEELQKFLVEEIASKTSDSIVAYRGKHRWVQTFEATHLENIEDLKPKVRDNGVYLITGGLGGIGLVLAEYLAQTSRVKLILMGRSRFPPSCEWEQWIKTHGEQDAISRKIRKLRSIEDLGSEVLILSADVADALQMKSVITQAYQRFGYINGVIHAAGIAGGGVMQLKTPESAKGVLAPKVKGTMVLGKLLDEVKLDFFVLCSSLDSFLGSTGQVDYCAANAFLDAYAHKHHRKNNVMSINWCAWQEVGMAVDTEVPLDLQERKEQRLKLGILAEEGKEIFSRVLKSSYSQVVISTQEFSSLLEQNKKVPSLDLEKKTEKEFLTQPKYDRPALSSEYIAPGNKTEQAVAEIWQQLLRIEKVGIHDNFFELGGHSLLATQLTARLRCAYPVEFSVASVFENPTVYSLSNMILDEKKGASFFVESRKRGQKRKERKKQRATKEK